MRDKKLDSVARVFVLVEAYALKRNTVDSNDTVSGSQLTEHCNGWVNLDDFSCERRPFDPVRGEYRKPPRCPANHK
jgi:hypothetical protein